jgi:hypothetical protein
VDSAGMDPGKIECLCALDPIGRRVNHLHPPFGAEARIE